MHNFTAAELVMFTEHIRGCTTAISLINHCANETDDQEIKSLCNRMIQDHQQGLQRYQKYLTPGAH